MSHRRRSVQPKPAGGKSLLRRSAVTWIRRCHALAAEAMAQGNHEFAVVCLRAGESWLDEAPPSLDRGRLVDERHRLVLKLDREVRA